MTLMTINCSTTAATSRLLSIAAPSIACSLWNVQSGVSSILDRGLFRVTGGDVTKQDTSHSVIPRQTLIANKEYNE